MFGQALVLDDQLKNVDDMQNTKLVAHEYLFVSEVKAALYVMYEYDIDNNLDVIACNVNLNNGDVFEFLNAVKSDPRLASIPLICYCVTPDLGLQALRVVAETLGADEFIASNAFDSRTVCREIDRWLTRRTQYLPPPEMGGFDDYANQ